MLTNNGPLYDYIEKKLKDMSYFVRKTEKEEPV